MSTLYKYDEPDLIHIGNFEYVYYIAGKVFEWLAEMEELQQRDLSPAEERDLPSSEI